MHGRHEVSEDGERSREVRVTEHLPYQLYWPCQLMEQETRCGVAEIVVAHVRQVGHLQGVPKAVVNVPSIERFPVSVLKTRSLSSRLVRPLRSC